MTRVFIKVNIAIGLYAIRIKILIGLGSRVGNIDDLINELAYQLKSINLILLI